MEENGGGRYSKLKSLSNFESYPKSIQVESYIDLVENFVSGPHNVTISNSWNARGKRWPSSTVSRESGEMF